MAAVSWRRAVQPASFAQLRPSDRGVHVSQSGVEADDLVAVALPIPWLRSSRTVRAVSADLVTTMPPSPEVMFFVGRTRTRRPRRRPRPGCRSASRRACAASSSTAMPPGGDHPDPGHIRRWLYRWTGMTARVREVMAASKASGSMQNESASMSTNTGLAPANFTALAVAANVNDGR